MNGKQSVLSAGDVNLDSRCIDFLRCVLIVFVVLIHTNLVADTSCEDSVYARGYDIMGNLLWLCNPLFFAISGYLFFYSVDFSGKVYACKEFVFRFRPTFHHRTLPDEDFCCFSDVPSDRHTVLPDCPSRQCNHQHQLLRPRVPYYI